MRRSCLQWGVVAHLALLLVAVQLEGGRTASSGAWPVPMGSAREFAHAQEPAHSERVKVLASSSEGLPRSVVLVCPDPTGPCDVDAGRTIQGPITYETVATLTCWQNRDGDWWGAVAYSHPTRFTPNSRVGSGSYLGWFPAAQLRPMTNETATRRPLSTT